MSVALKQLSATIPQAGQLKVDNFVDGSLISELESEGFIAKTYDGRELFWNAKTKMMIYR
jgi:hypothetical protein